MNTSLFALIIIAWLPAIIVTIFNLMWDLAFWQKREYKTSRLISQLKWDFHPTHRTAYLTAAKIVLFLMLSISLTQGASPFPWLLLVLVYSIWIHEILGAGEHFLSDKRIGIRFDLKMVTGLIISTIILNIPVGILLGMLNSSELSSSLGIGTAIPPLVSEGLVISPDIFLTLTFLSLLGLAYDLGAPVISSIIAVLLLRPLQWLESIMLVTKAKNKMSLVKDLKIIAITGSNGKTTTADLLSHILSTEYKVATSNHTETNITGVARTIINKVSANTEVLIIELGSYKPLDIMRVRKLVNVDIAVLTGVEHDHIGIFGSRQGLLEAKAEILQLLKPGATVIMNGDNDLTVEIAGRNLGKEILYYLEQDPHKQLHDNQLELDVYDARQNSIVGENFEFNLRNQTHELKITLPKIAKSYAHSILAAIASAHEVGMDLGKAIHILNDINFHKLNLYEEIVGDDESRIIIAPHSESVNAFKQALHFLHGSNSESTILVTSGIKELGKYKSDVYNKVTSKLFTDINLVITSDQLLANHLKHHHPRTQVRHALRTKDVITLLREYQVPGTTIMLQGEIDPQIVNLLRSENE